MKTLKENLRHFGFFTKDLQTELVTEALERISQLETAIGNECRQCEQNRKIKVCYACALHGVLEGGN